MPMRTASASSFAETFSAARSRVNKELIDLEESSSDTDATPLPSLTASGESTPPSLASPLTRPITPISQLEVADDFAFAFDIDGVLIRGGEPIPEAIEAMKVLNGENEWGISV